MLQQGPVIVQSPDLSTDWGTSAAHPSRNGVSVFRNLSNSQEEEATLKLYPSSHHLSRTEFEQEHGTPRLFKLRSDEILFVRGGIKMQMSLPAGGCLVWQGFSAEPWGLDPSSSEAFAFMRIY